MEQIKLALPLKHIFVTQPFGLKYLDFYKELGMEGHNGIDFRALRGCPIYAAHDGKIIKSHRDGTGGIVVEILDKYRSFKTIYYHNQRNLVKVGQIIKAGDKIALADNTGKYTTADHLHFELKFVDVHGNTEDKYNGYRGAIDPAPYFPKNWYKSRAYHRYGREQNWFVDWCFKYAPVNYVNQWTKSGRWVHKRMIKLGWRVPMSTEQVNAIIYGAWDFDTVVNPAMESNWQYLTKSEYLRGQRPFK